MAYQIKQLAALAGVSVRTLRYYDQIGLLTPARVAPNGYRLYEQEQVDRLQQICLYKTMRLPLATIKTLLAQSPAQQLISLQRQYQTLRAERQRLDQLLTLVQTTIQNQRGDNTMTDESKFAAFKAAQLATNEQRYGQESRKRYGETVVEQANQKYGQLTAEDYQRMQAVEADLMKALHTVVTNATSTVDQQQRVYALHREWLSFTWPNYSAAAHRGLAQLYLNDERFSAYYDQRAGVGATKCLAQIIDRNARD